MIDRITNYNRYIKLLAISPFIFLLLDADIAFATKKTLFKEYVYHASEIDSKVSSRAIALDQAERLLLEDLVTYLIKETGVQNLQLTKDQVETLVAGIVTIEVFNEKWNGKTYYIKAKVTADIKEVVKSVDILRKDIGKSKELDESKKKLENALMEIERLKKALLTDMADTKKQEEYSKIINELSAHYWFNKGYALNMSGNYKKAIDVFSRAINLAHKNAMAYNNRGLAHSYLGEYQQAIKDYSKAVEIDPQYVEAYTNLGVTYADLGNYQSSIKNFDKAVKIDPKNVKAYIGRGYAFAAFGSYQHAIREYSRAIEIDPKYIVAYYNRGNVYGQSGDYKKAIKDFNMVIKLNPQDADAYYNRGVAYGTLGKHQDAIKDFNMVIKLNPQDAKAYYNRGLAYNNSGNYQQAIQDFITAARLGHKGSQNLLSAKGIKW